MSYVEGTIEYGIRYGGGCREISFYKVDHNIEVYCGSSKATDLVTFADADYARDLSDRKSITGIVMMLNGGVVVAITASEEAKLAIWGNKLISQITGKVEIPVLLLLGDNKTCIQLQGGISNTSKIKHVDVAYHHIVDEIRNGKLESRWIIDSHMIADGLTKPLPGPAFKERELQLEW
ncbi:hypothetical protein K3495_g4880 [Podosphaera aphanis]|nr:hypothetical protein K3495_g4880 [Podosphaera aphanis]